MIARRGGGYPRAGAWSPNVEYRGVSLPLIMMAWLMRGDDVLATAVVAASRSERRRGLIGHERCDGAFILTPCRNVHTFGMKFSIDVISCDRDGTVLWMQTLRPGRVSKLGLRGHFVIEVGAGFVDRWTIRVGDSLEIRQ